MSKNQPQEDVNIRVKFPRDTHRRLRNYQQKLAIQLNRDITIQEALIDLVNRIRSKS